MDFLLLGEFASELSSLLDGLLELLVLSGLLLAHFFDLLLQSGHFRDGGLSCLLGSSQISLQLVDLSLLIVLGLLSNLQLVFELKGSPVSLGQLRLLEVSEELVVLFFSLSKLLKLHLDVEFLLELDDLVFPFLFFGLQVNKALLGGLQDFLLAIVPFLESLHVELEFLLDFLQLKVLVSQQLLEVIVFGFDVFGEGLLVLEFLLGSIQLNGVVLHVQGQTLVEVLLLVELILEDLAFVEGGEVLALVVGDHGLLVLDLLVLVEHFVLRLGQSVLDFLELSLLLGDLLVQAGDLVVEVLFHVFLDVMLVIKLEVHILLQSIFFLSTLFLQVAQLDLEHWDLFVLFELVGKQLVLVFNFTVQLFVLGFDFVLLFLDDVLGILDHSIQVGDVQVEVPDLLVVVQLLLGHFALLLLLSSLGQGLLLCQLFFEGLGVGLDLFVLFFDGLFLGNNLFLVALQGLLQVDDLILKGLDLLLVGLGNLLQLMVSVGGILVSFLDLLLILFDFSMKAIELLSSLSVVVLSLFQSMVSGVNLLLKLIDRFMKFVYLLLVGASFSVLFLDQLQYL